MAALLSERERRFLQRIADAGGFASRKQVGCVSSRDEDRARQNLRANGHAEYVGRVHGAPKDGWRITEAGRSALAASSPEGGT